MRILIVEDDQKIAFFLKKGFKEVGYAADGENGLTMVRQGIYDIIVAGRMRLRQCIGNLVDNAIKYSPEHSEVVLLGSSNETTVIFAVRDYGCGIAEEDFPRIWDRLYRAESSRATLGLGLSMAWAIVEVPGGTMDVQSQPDEGSTFRIYLPQKSLEIN